MQYVLLYLLELETMVCKEFNRVMILLCLAATRHFQSGEGPSRGLLRDCETSIFANVRLEL